MRAARPHQMPSRFSRTLLRCRMVSMPLNLLVKLNRKKAQVGSAVTVVEATPACSQEDRIRARKGHRLPANNNRGLGIPGMMVKILLTCVLRRSAYHLIIRRIRLQTQMSNQSLIVFNIKNRRNQSRCKTSRIMKN